METAIMKSIDSSSLLRGGGGPQPPPPTAAPFTSLSLDGRSFLLIDHRELLQVASAEQFAGRLGCPPSARVKVVSIFGNTGDGKSYTLNHTFFRGEEVFRTSAEQDSCTVGVWAAFDPRLGAICLDTEGLLGGSGLDENRRVRLLLKVLAISDVVVYRTRSERLHRDMFVFLGSASRAYSQHFQTALQAVGKLIRSANSGGGVAAAPPALGPAVIVFQETLNTRPLQFSMSESPEGVLRGKFSELQLELEAFSSLRYVGVQTKSSPTDFAQLRTAVRAELENTSVRSPRQPALVYHTLKVLNDKFSGEIPSAGVQLFPDQYFTCPEKCLSCERRCDAGMGHAKENKPHSCVERCRFQHQYENCQYICKACHTNGAEVVVTPKMISTSDSSWFGLAKYAWSGYVIECPNCGEIYRSRQYWYGNRNPEDAAVRTEIRHVWPGGGGSTLLGTQNAARKVLDGVSYISDAVVSVGSPPTRMLSSWVADQIAPRYWRPNHEIKCCNDCRKVFGAADTKHHCRACGEGFCQECSSYSMEVPERGWAGPVRVCARCHKAASAKLQREEAEDDAEVRARKYGEVVVNTITTVVSVLEYPKDLIKESVRPSYWQPDGEVVGCSCCGTRFGPRLAVHHCRDCGHAVCEPCSARRRPVPARGWDAPVRVCDRCCYQGR